MTTATPTDPRVLREDALAGMSAIVTGAGSGIGRGVALRLVELGASVTGIGRHEETLTETAEQASGSGRFDYRICNVRDLDAAIDALRSVGEERGLHLLVNNAGGQYFVPATEISVKGWNAVIDLNLTSIFHLTKAAYPYLAATRGCVVNMSLSGVERGGMGMVHSIAARAGVLGMTRTLALEWAEQGIRLNCLGPGTVITSALSGETSQHVLGNLVQRATPMKRPTPVADVAELVAYLASPAGALITGQLLQVDGGAHLGVGLHMLPEAYEALEATTVGSPA